MERILAFEDSKYSSSSFSGRHSDVLSDVWEYGAGDIFYADIVEMCGGVEGIAVQWANPDTFADGNGDGFDTFNWSDGEYILDVMFRGKDMSLFGLAFYPASSYPLYDY